MNLPADFITRTKFLLGKDWELFYTALKEKPTVSIRINKRKTLKSIGQEIKVPWCDNGYYLSERPQFTFDPLLHAGCYYVQEASSMFIEQAIQQYAGSNIKVLDLCASPGGKSTLIASLLDDDSLLVSNEIIRTRAYILAENMTKWGNPNIIITNDDPSKIGKTEDYFDIILVDAPCSGEGMFRKDENAIREWSLENIKLCKKRQQRILADIWPALKQGGLLLYSTCTYNKEENEENVEWIRDELGADVLPVKIREEWGISPSFSDDIPAYRFFPHKTKGEGFFFALLRKKGDAKSDKNRKKPDKTYKNKSELSVEYKGYIKDEGFVFYNKKDIWYTFPSSIYSELNCLASQLNVISEGVCLGEFKGKDFIPNQSLALSNVLNTNAFPTYEADWKTAIKYLKKEALVIEGQPKGYILLTYKNTPLGFVKNIGNRANNLYPQEWYIRSSNIPNEEVTVI